MKKLGLDLGTRTLGIAISDALGMMAHGVETFRFEEGHYKKPIQHVQELVKTHRISTIVLGLPKNMNGSIGERGIATQEFGKKLEEATNTPVVYWDERLTTMQVERVLIQADVSRSKRKKVVDKMAATVILQSYLDSSQR
ncbi:MAG TPA: Holliday junction resolvase RuvX [Firmicutes bacterium]|nr:Holliday junction resolvase RuvX [Bacillota bacterium]